MKEVGFLYCQLVYQGGLFYGVGFGGFGDQLLVIGVVVVQFQFVYVDIEVVFQELFVFWCQCYFGVFFQQGLLELELFGIYGGGVFD